jgi:beta-phosphoglucomutase-like phosphatase (HAD superfamily)
MPVEALLLDFDGTIVDSESVLYESWRRVYEMYGIALDCACWAAEVRPVNPHAAAARRLSERLKKPPAAEIAQRMQRRIEGDLMRDVSIRAAVAELIAS